MKKDKKICLIGFPRSRSSFMSESLALKYAISEERTIENLCDTYRINRTMSKEQFVKKYHANIRFLAAKKRFIIRFHPLYLTSYRNELTVFKLDDIFNFDLFDFTQYFKIIITTRNPVDQICSRVVARETGVWTYKKNGSRKPKTDISFTLGSDHRALTYAAIDWIVLGQLELYFNVNKIVYEIVDYEQVLSYAEHNELPIEAVSHLETKYDYKSIVLNYSDVIDYYNTELQVLRARLGLL